MYGIFITLHLIICVGLIISVLLQSSKGEGLAGGFAGSALTGTVFGGRGAATFLSRATTVLAIAFFASAIVLGFLRPATSGTATAAGESAVEQEQRQSPALPVTEPGAPTPTQGGSAPAQTQPAAQPQTQPAGQPAPGQTPGAGTEKPAPTGGETPK